MDVWRVVSSMVRLTFWSSFLSSTTLGGVLMAQLSDFGGLETVIGFIFQVILGGLAVVFGFCRYWGTQCGLGMVIL